jgi:hypothetical protein
MVVMTEGAEVDSLNSRAFNVHSLEGRECTSQKLMSSINVYAVGNVPSGKRLQIIA